MNLSPTCQPAWESGRTAVWFTGYSNRHFTILPSKGRINNAIWTTDGKEEETKGEEDLGRNDLGSAIEEKNIFTLSHCLSLSRRMMTSLGNIWWPFSLNDRFLPSKVTFMTYLEAQRQAGVRTSTLNYTQWHMLFFSPISIRVKTMKEKANLLLGWNISIPRKNKLKELNVYQQNNNIGSFAGQWK